jgi:hypothetical protein
MNNTHTCQALRRNDNDVLEECCETAICIVCAVQDGKFADVPMCQKCWGIAHSQKSITIHYVKPIVKEDEN